MLTATFIRWKRMAGASNGSELINRDIPRDSSFTLIIETGLSGLKTA